MTKQVPTDGLPPFNFRQTATGIATFSLPTLKVQHVTPTYSTDGITWGVTVFRQGRYIYIYGVEDTAQTTYAHLARARAGNLVGSWQFYTGSGWSPDPSSSARLLGNVGSSYSVTPVYGGYVLTTTNSALGSTIYTYTAASPTGPFTHRKAVYETPETAGDMYTYNVAAHPAISDPGQLVLSYNVNSFDIADTYRDASNYRPRFIRLELALPHRPAGAGDAGAS